MARRGTKIVFCYVYVVAERKRGGEKKVKMVDDRVGRAVVKATELELEKRIASRSAVPLGCLSRRMKSKRSLIRGVPTYEASPLRN